MKKEEYESLDEARLHANAVGSVVHMSKSMQDHGKGTVTYYGKDGHVKVKSHNTGKIHKFDYTGKGIGNVFDPDAYDMAIHASKMASMKKEEVELTLEDYSFEEIEYFMQTEEYEQLDEISKKTLGSYVKKSHTQSSQNSHYIGMGNNDPETRGKAIRSMNKRTKGIRKAVDRLTKEEVEQIEEMFPGTPEYEKKYGKAPQDMKKGEKKKTTQGEMEKTGKGVVHRRKFSEMVESYTEGGVKGLFKTLAEEPTSAEFDAQLADAKQRAAGTKKQPEVSKPAVQAVQNEEYELNFFTPEEIEEFMQTEEYEQLDELSKELLGRYKEKANKSAENKYRDSKTYATMAKNVERDANNRNMNVMKASKKLAKEGIEEQTHTTVSFVDYNDVNGVKYAEIDLSKKD
jgi:hypothetical protein